MKISYKISVALLSLLMLSSVGASSSQAHASHVHTPRIARSTRKVHTHQSRKQTKRGLIKSVKRQVNHKRNKSNWFKDGLSRRQLIARNWITTHESGNNWNILSYGHVCVGYFQLNPDYLGRYHGHINLNHKHQVKVADTYVANRYGSWVHAKHFWQAHHWY